MISTLNNTLTGATYHVDAHMHEAYAHLYNNRRAALFLEMSLSKTVITLTYLYDAIYKDAAFCKVLVIAPNNVAKFTWPDEIKKWQHLNDLRYSVVVGDQKQRLAALAKPAEVYIISESNLSWLVDQYITQRVSKKTKRPYGEYTGALPFDAFVIDELSKFKNSDSIKFRKFKRALKLSNINDRIGLTGTPVPNGYIDLWAQMYLLDDGVRLGPTKGEYETRYFDMVNHNMIQIKCDPKPGAIEKISKKISDIALTMKTRDKIELPELHIVNEILHFDEYDQDTYDYMAREYVLKDLEDVTAKTAADLVNKLLQLTSGAIYGEDREVHVLNTLKMDALRDIANKYDENMIIVYQFKHELTRIKAEFPDAVEFNDKTYEAWNRGEVSKLVIHPASAGHGLNLQFGGRRMVFVTPTYNLEHWLQTVSRLLRRGALDDIYVHRLLVKGTSDFKVAKVVAGKESSQDILMDHVKQLRNALL